MLYECVSGQAEEGWDDTDVIQMYVDPLSPMVKSYIDSISPEIELCTVRSENDAHIATHSMKQNKTPHMKPIQSFEPDDQPRRADGEEALH